MELHLFRTDTHREVAMSRLLPSDNQAQWQEPEPPALVHIEVEFQCLLPKARRQKVS